MNTPVKHPQNLTGLLWRIHEKTSSFAAHLIGPIVFNVGIKEPAWNLSTANLLCFPNGTVGKTLGEFLKSNRLEPIARAESHDLYHILFDFSSSFKDEVALQFFLRGNGKNSIASFGTSIGAWCILPTQWSYLRASYERGKKCMDVAKLDLKAILFKDFEEVRATLHQAN
ncbi:MAG: Coq4 family protein [Bacteroidia bacterium]